jgi:hypothetical protein
MQKWVLIFMLVSGSSWLAMDAGVPLERILSDGLGYALGKEGAFLIAAVCYGFLGVYFTMTMRVLIVAFRREMIARDEACVERVDKKDEKRIKKG